MPDNEDIDFGTAVKFEKDRRKLQKLVDDGIINAEDLNNAPIVEVDPPNGQPEPLRIRKVTCRTNGCHREFNTLAQFEEHLAIDHLGYIKEGD